MNTGNKLTCFKAYDVRGRLGKELNEEIAYRIGRATVQSLKAKTVALGHDARQTSPVLAQAVARGICDAGAVVFDTGLAGTEEIYFSVSAFNFDIGIDSDDILTSVLAVMDKLNTTRLNEDFTNGNIDSGVIESALGTASGLTTTGGNIVPEERIYDEGEFVGRPFSG